MTYRDAEQLCHFLDEADVELLVEPRGFGHKRGVPDSIIWMRPKGINIHRMFPILAELEGALFNVDDFEKFARRVTNEEPYQHHVNIPIVDADSTPFSVELPYDVLAVGSRYLSDAAELSESQYHDELRSWAETVRESFQTATRITVRGDTRLVWWHVTFPMYGHSFSTQIPFVVDAGDNLIEILKLQTSRLVIPAVAIINGSSTQQTQGCKRYRTDIHFSRFSSTQFKK